jgi:hypothetical protein
MHLYAESGLEEHIGEYLLFGDGHHFFFGDAGYAI